VLHDPLMTPPDALPEQGPDPRSNEIELPLMVPVALPKSQLALKLHPFWLTLHVPLAHDPDTVPEPLTCMHEPAEPLVPEDELLQPKSNQPPPSANVRARTVFMDDRISQRALQLAM
jgi:hypothetical protein